MVDSDPTESGRAQQEVFDRALDAALIVAQETFGINATDITVVPSDQERDISFPARYDPVERVVAIHSYSLQTFFEECTARYPNLLMADLAKVHITGGLIPSLVAQEVDPRDKTTVTTLLDHMTSIDSLSEMVNRFDAELGLDVWSLLQEALLKKSEAEIGKINALRLAIGALAFSEDVSTDVTTQSRETVDFSARVNSTFLDGFHELATDLERYIRGSVIMGLDSDFAREQFLTGISALEIAAAFPMEMHEVSFIAGLVKRSSQ